MINQEKFNELVKSLELATADDVANLLRSKGIKGKRVVAMACPISNYFVEEGGAVGASCFRHINVYNTERWDDSEDGEYHTSTPRAAYRFMIAFDQGDYPDLVEE